MPTPRRRRFRRPRVARITVTVPIRVPAVLHRVVPVERLQARMDALRDDLESRSTRDPPSLTRLRTMLATMEAEDRAALCDDKRADPARELGIDMLRAFFAAVAGKG